MKGGLCIIYTSLLTVSVVSSCALFILAVSEALQVEEIKDDVDLSGLHNVSQKMSNLESKPTQLPTIEPEVINVPPEEKTEEPDKMMFPEMLSVNSVTTDGWFWIQNSTTPAPPGMSYKATNNHVIFKTYHIVRVRWICM